MCTGFYSRVCDGGVSVQGNGMCVCEEGGSSGRRDGGR